MIQSRHRRKLGLCSSLLPLIVRDRGSGVESSSSPRTTRTPTQAGTGYSRHGSMWRTGGSKLSPALPCGRVSLVTSHWSVMGRQRHPAILGCPQFRYALLPTKLLWRCNARSGPTLDVRRGALVASGRRVTGGTCRRPRRGAGQSRGLAILVGRSEGAETGFGLSVFSSHEVDILRHSWCYFSAA